MDNMYKVMAFWTGIFAVMFYLGGMNEVSLLFVGNTVILIIRLLEPFRTYVHVHFRSIFNCILRWLHVLYNIHSRTWWRSLIQKIACLKILRHAFFITYRYHMPFKTPVKAI
ncbi:hypothetical protein LSPH24S_05024 [Lysinibacillus sphaericus]